MSRLKLPNWSRGWLAALLFTLAYVMFSQEDLNLLYLGIGTIALLGFAYVAITALEGD